MLPAGSVTAYCPPVTASLVPSLSDRVGQSFELLSKGSKKPSSVDGVADGLGAAELLRRVAGLGCRAGR